MPTIIRIGFTALTLVLVLAARDGSSKTMTHAGAGTKSQITLRVGERDVVVTLADAREMRKALEAYLEGARKTPPQTLPAGVIDRVPRPGEPFIQDGDLRLGTWVLGTWGDKLVLMDTHASADGRRLAYQYVAYLSKADHRWVVTAIFLGRFR